MRAVRTLAVLAAALALAGCAPAPVAPTPSGSATPTGSGVVIAASSGPAIDRPQLPPPTAAVAGIVTGLPGDGLRGYLDQQPEWVDCGAGTECTTVLAPLDYAEPEQRALKLALRRRPATAGPRLGSLFINPGGPGASGQDLVARFASEGLERYDIVGWDPRGTGDSTPVKCFSDAEVDAYTAMDLSPDSETERAELLAAVARFGQSCWERSGELLPYLSTIETVRDLDLLRRLLADDRLNYLGYSYGTQIGATYAELFGPTSGRLVLDAAVDITDDQEVIQAMGFDLALGNFATWCADRACALGRSKGTVLGSVTSLFDALDARPIRGAAGRDLTQSLAVTGVAAMLYGGREAWPTLAALLDAARQGNGRGLLLAADALNGRDERGHYDPMFFAFPAISCLDRVENGVLDADRLWQEDIAKAPIFGRYFGPQYNCALWPVRPARQLQLDAAEARPLLVIGGTGDNATPYQQAVTMAEQLKPAVLLTYEGEGHGSYGGNSACIDELVVAYLVRGEVPTDGARCR